LVVSAETWGKIKGTLVTGGCGSLSASLQELREAAEALSSSRPKMSFFISEE
jgi:hypothetical protein